MNELLFVLFENFLINRFKLLFIFVIHALLKSCEVMIKLVSCKPFRSLDQKIGKAHPDLYVDNPQITCVS